MNSANTRTEARANANDVVFVSPATVFWGAERSMLSIAGELRKTGIECDLVCASAVVAENWDRVISRKAQVYRPLPKRVGRWMRALSFLPAIAKIPANRTIVLFDIDLLLPSLFLRPLLRRRGSTVVLDLHTVSSSESGRKRLKVLAKYIDGCIAVSRFAAEQMPVSIATRVVHRPMEVDFVSSDAPKSDTVTFGVIGRVDAQKNIEFAIAAAARAQVGARVVVRGARRRAALSTLSTSSTSAGRSWVRTSATRARWQTRRSSPGSISCCS
ncbi:glycosyltransferase [Rhodococcus sp. GG48]|nr:glycosyltransferase [Rhodococcus sp. GG48]